MVALALAACLAAGAGPPRIDPVRVGTSADYAPFSYAEGASADPEGFDLELVRAWAEDRNRALVLVRFRWPDLLGDLESGRFDLAASGITVRPERSAAGLFTVPLAETSVWALARGETASGGVAALDRPGIRIAVNAGGHLERVARARFPHATLVAVADNEAVIGLLVEGRVHAVVTDDVEAPHWATRIHEPLARVGPLSLDRKAWLVRPDQAVLADDLDAWLLDREADGTLSSLRAKWLGAATARTADPLGALLAAIDERLALMPLVAAAKGREGAPLEVPERERLVVERALADLHAEAERTGRESPPAAPVRALFRVQLETAKQVQARAAADPDLPRTAAPDLDSVLRPALLRIGAREASLLLRLPPDLDRAAVRAAARSALRAAYLDDAQRDAVADAIFACSEGSAQRVRARATKPASSGSSAHVP